MGFDTLPAVRMVMCYRSADGTSLIPVDVSSPLPTGAGGGSDGTVVSSALNNLPAQRVELCYLSADGTTLIPVSQANPLPGGSAGGVSQATMDAAIAAAVVGLLDYKGTIDCSANPNYPAASKGDTYIVSVAGKIGGASGEVVEAGDTLICKADVAAGTQAGVGSSWNIVQKNDGFTVLASPLFAFETLGQLISVDISVAGLLTTDVVTLGLPASLDSSITNAPGVYIFVPIVTAAGNLRIWGYDVAAAGNDVTLTNLRIKVSR